MRRRKGSLRVRVPLGALAVALLLPLVAGCSPAAADCSPVQNGIVVCLEGRPVTWQAEVKPHLHDRYIYGPLEEFAAYLGAPVVTSDGPASVRVAGVPIAPEPGDDRGIHEHGGLLYAPLKQVAEAAGFRVLILSDRSVVSIRR
jgi:hypothetical protein